MLSFEQMFQDSVSFLCFPEFCVFISTDLLHLPRFCTDVQIFILLSSSLSECTLVLFAEASIKPVSKQNRSYSVNYVSPKESSRYLIILIPKTINM